MPGFPRRARLLQPGDYKAVLSGGRRLNESRLTAVVIDGTSDRARLGLAISSRVAREAVERNRIKRLARETFRHHRTSLPTVDIVILARNGAAAASAAILRSDLERLWQRIRNGR